MNRFLISLLMATLTTGALQAETLARSTGVAVLNAFIATYAKAEVAWKKDIRLNENPGQLEPGRQLGQSAVAGYYSFIPKFWSDLTPDEQIRVLKDPRLKAFLISSRIASTYPVAATGESVFPVEGAAVVPRDPEKSPVNSFTQSPAFTAAAPDPGNAGAPSAGATAGTSGSEATPVIIKVTPNAVLKGQPVRVDIK